MSQPILLIFGVGKNIGATTVKKFLSNGYRVASATRSAKPDDSDTEKLLLPCDITKPDTVSAAFASVRKTWGEPSVVIFNGKENSVRSRRTKPHVDDG
jgi:NAD(P)-dependent dehydrogenase (short-subunit alcohol dehydrogenase family)